MTPTTPSLRLTAVTHLRPGVTFVDPATERRHTARGVVFDGGLVRVRDTTGGVLWLPEHHLIAIEEPPTN